MRISGVELPKRKRVIISLRSIYGIGPKKSEDICTALGIDFKKRTFELTDEEGKDIQNYIENNEISVEGDLKRKQNDIFRAQMAIKLNRAVRRRKGLPCRGQRTHSNGKTASKLGGIK